MRSRDAIMPFRCSDESRMLMLISTMDCLNWGSPMTLFMDTSRACASSSVLLMLLNIASMPASSVPNI